MATVMGRLAWLAAKVTVPSLKAILALLGLVAVALLVHRIGAAPIVATLDRLTWWHFALLCVP